MFLRRMATSVLIVAVLSVLGFLGNNTVLTKDRNDLAYNNANLIRLHIVANSDSTDDQRIKLKVRDAVVAESKKYFVNLRTPAEALRAAVSNSPNLAALAGRVAKANGASYGARVEVGRFDFPTRAYPFGTLPAGRYQAVRITLGRGEGRNWWCVLFPPLCFLKPEADGEVKGPVQVRLRFLEELLARNGQLMDAFWKGWARFWGLTKHSAAT